VRRSVKSACRIAAKACWTALVIASGFGCSRPSLAQVAQVIPTAETQPVPHSGDAADDPCIWVHPTDPSLSTVIGTDKQGGLAVYDLSGTQLQYLADGNMNNVDIRYQFPLGGGSVDLVTTGNRTNDSIAIYKVNPLTRTLVNVAARTITVGITMYGSSMYHSPTTGKFYAFINSPNGEVEQWELFDNGSGLVDATRVRAFTVGSITEGCVADDELGKFYIAEENVGIWKYGAEPGDGTTRTEVEAVGPHLTADIEGLTIYYASSGTGYLLASSQGSSQYAIYAREGSNAWIANFQIGSSTTIDSVTNTDGIDVINVNLGPAFPQGVFIAQDDTNYTGAAGDNQNYKLVPWPSIANAFNPQLTIDTSWNPRGSASDSDGDGYPAPADCDDSNPAVHPGATETCNGIDDDCDTVIDNGGNALCNDTNACTTDTCTGAPGCTHAGNTLPCDDGNPCTVGDACSGGACVGGSAPNCDDGNLCTDDACSQASGCVHVNNAAVCSDGDACTTGDMCLGGSCVGGPAPNCDDGNVCTDDSCTPANGCVHADNTATCSDSTACATSGICSAGACVQGDANLDTSGFSANRVDGRDLVVMADAWNSCPGDARYDIAANLDQGVTPTGACVDGTDFHLFMSSFGHSCP